ncbi:DUF221-domain-containing protein [Xylariaceae sp. FL1272]|nr:DUF221-domain-containing protein [Xylariaceae sp. FL1272]
MAPDDDDPPDWCKGENALAPGNKDIYVQLVLSFGLGVTAFIAFCILRPRWKTLYAARKRHKDPQIALPVLPDSFLGWIPALYRVTEDQVLASAGLDAFVFLSFFKMALKLFATMFVFSVAVLLPVHRTFADDLDPNHRNTSMIEPNLFVDDLHSSTFKHGSAKNRSWVWVYLIFTWFFSALTIYFMNAETYRVVEIRQDYLGTQSTVTDRTFRLTGIPKDLRTEDKIKDFVENLEIGHVRKVALCRKWTEIDGLMAQRQIMLRKLEEAWTAYRAQKAIVSRTVASAEPTLGTHQPDIEQGEDADENGRLLGDEDDPHNVLGERERPKIRLRFGFLKMRNRKVDALDYYEERLRRLDEKIHTARRKEYPPTDTAFVTMDSIAACQMAIQAVIDPRPGRLLTKPAPAPSDVIWKNTYAPRYRRRLQSAIVTVFIILLTILWFFPVAILAQLLSICSIKKVAPQFGEFLEDHNVTQVLVRTGLPTLVVSLLNVLVPFLYDWLSNIQGAISQGDVELSAISKNFFFVFFNIFVVYAVSGSAAMAEFWQIIRDSLSDTSQIAARIAQSIQKLNNFYLNFIMLQAFGLFPFKLLQFGSVSMYPIYRMGAKTPRDFAGLVQPTLFNYGFFLPTALLVFILCLVYSVLPGSPVVLLLGICYFGLGYFVYKYQLLYSMDQPQHATGRAWTMICRRIILGLISFQIVMLAILVLREAFGEAALIVPLTLLTLWYNWDYHRRFDPPTRFIALRSINRNSDPGRQSNPDQDEQQPMRLARRMSTIDEDREKGMSFVNPSLVIPLEQPWIYQDPPPPISPSESIVEGSSIHDYGNTITNNDSRPAILEGYNADTAVSASSSISLGDTHVWRDSGEDNV